MVELEQITRGQDLRTASKLQLSFLGSANDRFKSALQPLESDLPRRLASGPEIDCV